MTGSIVQTRRAGAGFGALALVGLALLALAGTAQADIFPNRGGGGPAYHSDPVSGYPCISNNCDLLRLPGANCICQKQNPGEQDLSKLRLKCSTREGGRWVACPVKPRYGISVD